MSRQHNNTTAESTWSVARIWNVVERRMGKRPSWFQVQVAEALYLRQKDVVGISATGTGKTLSFWMPLIMALEDGKDKMTIVITPLNILGQQNVADLEAAGIPAIAVSADKATPEIFKDIERGMYRVVVVNPEIIMQHRGEFETMWNKPAFMSRLLNITVDEGHVVKQWGAFRPEYNYLGQIRSMIPTTVPFYVASATLPTPTLQYVMEHL
ncbi:hypothetical protein QCA50_016373 [Cerrena zonata]|uniref:Helicase ATP-binding domain-containing protein n=1 Tax=Cerrena zonata TaxID=2478898 RepID=A0AAW0FIM1_9APHY